MKRTVLVAEPIGESGIALLQAATDIDVVLGYGLTETALSETLSRAEALIVRSGTRVDAEMIANAKRLRVIVRAGTGIDNIDLDAATARGIVVMNTPGGNTNAACEQTLALLFALARHIAAANQSLREGRWERDRFVGWELKGKTLGLIGLGRIGTEVAIRAQALRMAVMAYDPFVSQVNVESSSIELVELDELLRRADIVSLHLPLTDQTHHLLGRSQFEQMRRGVYVINCARGGLLDEDALLEALESGQIAGAAIDAFSTEPKPNPRLVGHPRVVSTPHLGASTNEAKASVGMQAARQALGVLESTSFENAINVPLGDPKLLERLSPHLKLAERLGSLQIQLVESGVREVSIAIAGDIEETAPLRLAFLRGLLTPIVGASVNYVNAPYLAAQRGIRVTESHTSTTTDDYNFVLTTTVETDSGPHTVRGTLLERRAPRVIEIDGFRLDVIPDGHLVVCRSRDRPGVIGAIGTVFGRHEANISEFRLGRSGPGDLALSVITLDAAAAPEALDSLRALPDVLSVKPVKL